MDEIKAILLFVFLPFSTQGQQDEITQFLRKSQVVDSIPSNPHSGSRFLFHTPDSVYYFYYFTSGVCKLQILRGDTIQIQKISNHRTNTSVVPDLPVEAPRKHTDIHGNVSYDFFYRSAIDTPYADRNVMQHTLSTNLYTTIRNELPVVIQLNVRKSNSYLFKNYVDANIQFDGTAYRSLTKQRLKTQAISLLKQKSPEQELQNALQKLYAIRQQLESWLLDGRQLQRAIESRQALLKDLTDLNSLEWAGGDNGRQLLMDSIQRRRENLALHHYQDYLNKVRQNKGSIKSLRQSYSKIQNEVSGLALTDKQEKAIAFLNEYADKNKRYKEYNRKIDSLQEKYQSAKQALQQRKDSVTSIIDGTANPAALKQFMKEYRLDSLKIYRRMNHLLSIKKLAVGRTNVDYSELTVKNISVTGINTEYYNRFYFAAAAGTVDYRYRDFIVAGIPKLPQYLTLVRAGLGDIAETGITVTVYRGKKQATWFNDQNRPGVSSVFGIALETRYRMDKNNFIVAEAAKSSYPGFVPLQNSNAATGKPLRLSDRSNEAYSVQLFSNFPSTQTRLYGQYKKLGINFQSFNIFNYNANYHVWHVRGDQYLLKRKLFISASVKTNEYNSPYAIYRYKSNTLFTTVQATLRLKKWPVLSTAYMPSSQLYKTGNDIIETRFSTLMASANYMFKAGRYYMYSMVMYNKFFNDRDQQQFMYYNASNWLLNLSMMHEAFSLNTTAGLSYNADYRLHTLDEGFQYRFNKWLRAGSGLKWNVLNTTTHAIGYYGNMKLLLRKLGEFDLSFDHGFLPGLNSGLLPNNMGRIIYFKTF